MCLNMTRSGVIDGCGADASWQTGVDQAQDWGLTLATAEAWDAGHKQMMRDTTAALAPHGFLLGKDPWELGDYVNGVLHEGCVAENDTITTLQNLTARAKAQNRRLIYQCHGGRGNVLNEVAAFLCGAGEYHYYGLGGWNGVGSSGCAPLPLLPPQSRSQAHFASVCLGTGTLASTGSTVSSISSWARRWETPATTAPPAPGVAPSPAAQRLSSTRLRRRERSRGARGACVLCEVELRGRAVEDH